MVKVIMSTQQGLGITETGHFITIDGEKVKIGLLKKGSGNARIFGVHNSQNIKGIFALVQWFKNGTKLEKIAYDVTSLTPKDATQEMEEWMPKLQYSEQNETSVLLCIVEHEQEEQVTIKAKTIKYYL